MIRKDANGIDHADVELVVALARGASIKAAARTLGAHVATVYRRLGRIEQRLGGPLFERDDGRLFPNARAAPILEAAEALSERLHALDLTLAAADARLVGPLAVTTPDSLIGPVCRLVHAFQRAHPGVEISLTVSSAFADLGRREADVAIRPTRTPPETLLGRLVGGFDFRVYVARDAPAEGLGWITFDDSMLGAPSARWVAHKGQAEGSSCRVNSMAVAAEAAASGLGRAVLPEYLADARLRGVGEAIPELASELWVLSHPDLKASPRIRAFTAFATEHLRQALSGVEIRSRDDP